MNFTQIVQPIKNLSGWASFVVLSSQVVRTSSTPQPENKEAESIVSVYGSSDDLSWDTA
jgi:hypothetical protein